MSQIQTYDDDKSLQSSHSSNVGLDASIYRHMFDMTASLRGDGDLTSGKGDDLVSGTEA